METPKEYYYTYYSYEEWGRGYFGSRKCYCLPEKDVNYLGSSKDKTFKPKYKIILKDDYNTREEAYADEIILQEHYKVVENPHFANRAYQTTTKFCLSREQAIENGRKVGKITGKMCYELGLGIFSLTEDEMQMARIRGAKIGGGKGSKKGGERALELGVGIHSLTLEQMSKNGKKGGEKVKELGVGIHALTTEQRSKNGKKLGQKHKENNTGVCGIPTEQRRENVKITNTQKWICLETGYTTTSGPLTLYQRNRGIDTSKRIRVS